MNKDINYVRSLLQKKQKENLSDEDKEKVEALEVLLSHNNPFFDLDIATSIEILYFLGVTPEEVDELYAALISPSAFKENSSQFMINLK